jgi:uncharacterized membrane protein
LSIKFKTQFGRWKNLKKNLSQRKAKEKKVKKLKNKKKNPKKEKKENLNSMYMIINGLNLMDVLNLYLNGTLKPEKLLKNIIHCKTLKVLSISLYLTWLLSMKSVNKIRKKKISEKEIYSYN